MKYIRALGESKKKTRDVEILRRAVTILEAMIKHQDIFNDPMPSLTILQAAKDDYESKLATSSMTRRVQDISLKNEAKAILADILQKLAFYVNTVADGHLPTLYAAGFRMTSPRTTGLLPETPAWVHVQDGPLSGSARIDFEKIMGNRITYHYSYSITDDLQGIPAWGDFTHTTRTRRNIIDGLVPRTVVHVRIRAINANGVSEWTSPIKHIVR